jgi:enoyl-CoA hydratase
VQYVLPDEVRVTIDGPVRIVTMHRPERSNAVNAALHRGMTDVWRQLTADDKAHAVVLTGSGRAFSAGGDFEFFERLRSDLAGRRQSMAEARELIAALVAFPLPVVAAVNGPAVGLGCSLAALCDIVLMDENAYLADSHVAVGLVAGDGNVATWPLLASLLKAKEYLYTGDRIDAAEAERLGLANRVVPAGTALEAALTLARRLAALPTEALRDTKRALNMHVQRAVDGIIDFALAAESESFTSEGHAAAVARFRTRPR